MYPYCTLDSILNISLKRKIHDEHMFFYGAVHKKANYKIDLYTLILQLWLRWFNKHFQFNLSYDLNFNNYT